MLKSIILAYGKSENNCKKLFWFSLGFNFSKTCFFTIFYQKVGKIDGKMMISAKNNEDF